MPFGGPSIRILMKNIHLKRASQKKMTSPKLGFLFRNLNVTFYGLSTFCYTLLLSTELTYILIVFLKCLRLDRISQTESFFSTWLPSVGHTFPPRITPHECSIIWNTCGISHPCETVQHPAWLPKGTHSGFTYTIYMFAESLSISKAGPYENVFISFHF